MIKEALIFTAGVCVAAGFRRFIFCPLMRYEYKRHKPATLEYRAGLAFDTLNTIAKDRRMTAEQLRSYAYSFLMTIGEYQKCSYL